MKRNRGAVALARLGLTDDAIAAACAKNGAPVSRQAAQFWRTEKRKPDTDARAALQAAFAIDASWWDQVEADVPVSVDTLERFTRISERIWSLFDGDPLGDSSAASTWVERIEAILDGAMLASAIAATREVPTMAQLEERVRRQAEKQIALVETTTDALPLEKVRVLEKLWNIVKPNASEAKLAKSKQWIALRDKLISVVVKFPDAREAILQALESVDES